MSNATMSLNDADLEEELSRPSAALVSDLSTLTGDLLILGAGGKMGPSMCVLARRALDAAGLPDRRVIAVSRWSNPVARATMESHGVETVSFDLLGDSSYEELPDAADVLYLVGAKFGTASDAGRLWQTNTVVAALAARRYRSSRIVALSTGNVYPMVAPSTGGCDESAPVGPIGEYAASCLGRERVLSHAGATWGTPLAVIRLNYAVEPRYGVLSDVVSAVHQGRAVDLATGWVNVVWQRYANEVVLRALGHAAPEVPVINLTGPEILSLRNLAVRAGELLGVEPVLVGTEEGTALLNDASRCHQLFGLPDRSADELLEWQVEWVRNGGTSWGKPTKFQVRDGRF